MKVTNSKFKVTDNYLPSYEIGGGSSNAMPKEWGNLEVEIKGF